MLPTSPYSTGMGLSPMVFLLNWQSCLSNFLGPPVDAGQGTFLLEKALDALLSFFIEDPLLDFHQVKEKSLEVFQCFISMVLLPFSSTRKYFIT